jgi:hypothetical protein
VIGADFFLASGAFLAMMISWDQPLIIDLFELILTGLVVFASIVWLIFPFIVMSKIRGIREEMEKGNQLLAKISSGSTHSAPHFSRPKVVPPPKTVPIPKVVPIAGVIEPPSVVPLKISRRGQ